MHMTCLEETILIDADYMILSNKLNDCWGHNNDLMMSWDYKDICAYRELPTQNKSWVLQCIGQLWCTLRKQNM